MEKQFFAVIGAQRSGTTYLYNQLDAHPEILMAKPVRPEPKFFLDEEYHEYGVDYYLNTYFDNLTTEKVIGEKSTSYIEHPISGKRIKQFFPNAIFIIVLRNPIYRAISNYHFTKKNGLENRSIEEVFISNKTDLKKEVRASVSPFDYLKRGNYVYYLEKYIKYVEPSNIKILTYEQITKDYSAIQEIYNFLGVDQHFLSPDRNIKINTSNLDEEVPFSVLERLKNHFGPLNKLLEKKFLVDISHWDI